MSSTEIEPFAAEEISGDVRAPWDRLDGEAPEDYALFRGYLDQGAARNIRVLAERVAVPRDRCQRLSVTNSWVVRAAEFDADVTRKALAELEGEGIEMRARHAEVAKEIMAKAMDAVEFIDPRFLQARDIPVWIDVASKLERTSRGVQESKRIELTGAGGGPIEVANNLGANDRRALLAAVNEQIAQRLKAPELEIGPVDGVDDHEEIIDAEVVEGDGLS